MICKVNVCDKGSRWLLGSNSTHFGMISGWKKGSLSLRSLILGPLKGNEDILGVRLDGPFLPQVYVCIFLVNPKGIVYGSPRIEKRNNGFYYSVFPLKKYFAVVFAVIIFNFQQNKQYPKALSLWIMLVRNGYWNLSNISMVWPPSIVLMIKATPTRKIPIDKDKLSWISSANGNFDPKNAYKSR